MCENGSQETGVQVNTLVQGAVTGLDREEHGGDQKLSEPVYILAGTVWGPQGQDHAFIYWQPVLGWQGAPGHKPLDSSPVLASPYPVGIGAAGLGTATRHLNSCHC